MNEFMVRAAPDPPMLCMSGGDSVLPATKQEVLGGGHRAKQASPYVKES